MKNLLVVAGDRALTKFIAETLLQKKIERAAPACAATVGPSLALTRRSKGS